MSPLELGPQIKVSAGTETAPRESNFICPPRDQKTSTVLQTVVEYTAPIDLNYFLFSSTFFKG